MSAFWGEGRSTSAVPKNIEELKNSGFNELIVWSVEVGSTGDLNLNGEFPLTSEGDYIGNETYPDFPADLKKIKTGKVKRVTLSIGSSHLGDLENIKALVDSQGTGPEQHPLQGFRRAEGRRYRSMRSISMTRTAMTSSSRSNSR